MILRKAVSTLCAFSLFFLPCFNNHTNSVLALTAQNSEKNRVLGGKKRLKKAFKVFALMSIFPCGLFLAHMLNDGQHDGASKREKSKSNNMNRISDKPEPIGIMHRLVQNFINCHPTENNDDIRAAVSGYVNKTFCFRYTYPVNSNGILSENKVVTQEIFSVSQDKNVNFFLEDNHPLKHILYFIFVTCGINHSPYIEELGDKMVFDLDGYIDDILGTNLSFQCDRVSRFADFCKMFNVGVLSLINKQRFDDLIKKDGEFSLEEIKGSFINHADKSDLDATQILSKIQRRQLLYKWVNIDINGLPVPMYFVNTIPKNYDEFQSMMIYDYKNNSKKRLLNLESELLPICILEAPTEKYIHRKEFLDKDGVSFVCDFFECDRWARNNFDMSFQQVYDACDRIITSGGASYYGIECESRTKLLSFGCWDFSNFC